MSGISVCWGIKGRPRTLGLSATGGSSSSRTGSCFSPRGCEGTDRSKCYFCSGSTMAWPYTSRRNPEQQKKIRIEEQKGEEEWEKAWQWTGELVTQCVIIGECKTTLVNQTWSHRTVLIILQYNYKLMTCFEKKTSVPSICKHSEVKLNVLLYVNKLSHVKSLKGKLLCWTHRQKMSLKIKWKSWFQP